MITQDAVVLPPVESITDRLGKCNGGNNDLVVCPDETQCIMYLASSLAPLRHMVRNLLIICIIGAQVLYATPVLEPSMPLVLVTVKHLHHYNSASSTVSYLKDCIVLKSQPP